MLASAKTFETSTWTGLLGAAGLVALCSTWTAVGAQEAGKAPKPRHEAAAADENPGDSPEKDAAERLTEHLSDLADRIREDASPVGEEIRKALESAVSTVNETLKNEDFTVEDLRGAFDRAGETLRRSFRDGGPIDRETREAWEKARQELRDALTKANDNTREALRDRYAAERERLLGDEGLDEPGASEELTKARREVRELQGKLREALRRLADLERRELHERRVRPPSPPARPAEPERVVPGTGTRRDDRRIENLEKKMEQILNELKSLKEERAKEKPRGDQD